MARSEGNGPQLTWINIIATVAVLLTLAGGSWLLIQEQFAAVEKQIKTADDNNNHGIVDLAAALGRLRDQSVLRPEHEEFVKRLDERARVLQEQLKVLEATRPTTAELQQTATAMEKQLSEMKERMRSLEDYMRRPLPLAPITPPLPQQQGGQSSHQ